MEIEVIPIPENMEFQMSTGFLIVDSTSSFVKGWEKYLRFEGNYQSFKNNEGIFSPLDGFPKPIPLRNCNKTDFSESVSVQYDLMALDQAICFEKSQLQIGGDFSGDYVNYVYINLGPCINTTENNFSCKSKEEILEFISNGKISISLHHDDIQYNAHNYSFPIRKFITENNYILDKSVSKN